MNNIQQAIEHYIVDHSGFDEYRNYLGMSRLSECPRKIYNEFLRGTPINENTHRMAYAGYEQEKCILDMLIGSHVAQLSPRELIAPFDNRIKGHIDAETLDGQLLEIKSVSAFKWKKIVEENRPLHSHAVQVQMYMHYGGYKKGIIVYRNRETYEHIVFEEHPSPEKVRKYELKAQIILRAIDDDIAPMCECGRCKN